MFETYLAEAAKLLAQYTEGAVFAKDSFNAIVARAVEVLGSDASAAHLAEVMRPCDGCGTATRRETAEAEAVALYCPTCACEVGTVWQDAA
jgi:late competence protein required for DNA uptake (superfamily II DNA/RNA helicase)